MQIFRLIKEYLIDVETFIEVLRNRIGLVNPLSAARDGIISKKGELYDGDRIFYYTFHGRGCKVIVCERIVDFDFGEDFRCDGFDLWRLNIYLESRKLDFLELNEESVVKEQFNALVEQGIIHRGDKLDELYYFANT